MGDIVLNPSLRKSIHYLRHRTAGHMSNLACLRFRVNAATERSKHRHLWITRRIRTIAVFPINWERLDARVFTPTLPATKRKSRTCAATRETHVIFKRKHCSRRRRYTQVELSSPRKCAEKTQTIARKRWHGARKRKRWNVRSTCGRLRQRMWNWSSHRMCRRYGVHASHPYSSVGGTTAQYTLTLVAGCTPRSLQRRFVSLPNDPLALPIRVEISSSINAFCDIVLPKYVNLSVTFSGLLSIVMVGTV